VKDKTYQAAEDGDEAEKLVVALSNHDERVDD